MTATCDALDALAIMAAYLLWVVFAWGGSAGQRTATPSIKETRDASLSRDETPAIFRPPGWVFGIVWFSLYTLLTVSTYAAIVSAEDFGQSTALLVAVLLVAAAVLNVAWSWFYVEQRRGESLSDIVALLAVGVLLLVLFVSQHVSTGHLAYAAVHYVTWSLHTAWLSYATLILVFQYAHAA